MEGQQVQVRSGRMRRRARPASTSSEATAGQVEASTAESGGVTMGLLGTVNYYIKDYLDRCQLSATSSAFSRECRQHKIPVGEKVRTGGDGDEDDQEQADKLVSEETVEHALDMFDCAYEDAFFKVWDDPDAVPHAHDTSSYLKVNFRLHLYFCCRKMAEDLAPAADCLQSIRDFFDREGSALSREQEFIHFFALPFVPDPQSHPTFRALFQTGNWMRLRSDLEAYLHDLRLTGRFNSELVRLVLAHAWQQQQQDQHQQGVGQHQQGARVDLYRQFVARERDAQRTRRRYSQLVANHQQLRKDYQKLIAVTKELTSGLEMVAKATQSAPNSANPGHPSSSAQAIQWDSILGNCSRIYPELFPPVSPSARVRRELPKMNGDILHQAKWNHNASHPSSSSSSPTRQLSLNQSSSHSSGLDGRRSATEDFVSSLRLAAAAGDDGGIVRKRQLDFSKIKRDLLLEDAPRKKLLLLQALRWLLTRTTNGRRFAVLDLFLDADLLGFKPGGDDGSSSSLRDRLLADVLPSDPALWKKGEGGAGDASTESAPPTPPALAQQSSVARLVNAMASIKKGRDYLGSFDRFVETLIDCLLALGVARQKKTVEMIVATLQKLSLKCLIRKKMIERGILEWLINYLGAATTTTSTSTYGLEYSTALFMNLCLHRAGKEKCLPQADRVMQIFSSLLDSSTKQVLPYVNGTLYSLLGHPKFVQEAKHIGLESKIEERKKNSDEETRKQLEYVQEQMQHAAAAASASSEDLKAETDSVAVTNISDDDEDDSAGGADGSSGSDSVDEDIEIEDEIDAGDTVAAEDGEVAGAELLEQEYLLNSEGPLTESESSVSLGLNKSGEVMTDGSSTSKSSKSDEEDTVKPAQQQQSTSATNKESEEDEKASDEKKPKLERPGTVTLSKRPNEVDAGEEAKQSSQEPNVKLKDKPEDEVSKSKRDEMQDVARVTEDKEHSAEVEKETKEDAGGGSRPPAPPPTVVAKTDPPPPRQHPDPIPTSSSSDEGVVMVPNVAGNKKGGAQRRAKVTTQETVTKEDIVPLGGTSSSTKGPSRKTPKDETAGGGGVARAKHHQGSSTTSNNSTARRNSTKKVTPPSQQQQEGSLPRLPRSNSNPNAAASASAVGSNGSGVPLNPSVPLPPVPKMPSSPPISEERQDTGVISRRGSLAAAAGVKQQQGDAAAAAAPNTVQGKAVLPPLQAAGESKSGASAASRPGSRPRRSSGTATARQSRSSSAARRANAAPGDKRPISMSFPYNPLSQAEYSLRPDDVGADHHAFSSASSGVSSAGGGDSTASSSSSPLCNSASYTAPSPPPSPRKRWRKQFISLSTAEVSLLVANSSNGNITTGRLNNEMMAAAAATLTIDVGGVDKMSGQLQQKQQQQPHREHFY